MIINENIIKNALRKAINEMIGEDRIENNDGTVEVDNLQGIEKLLDFKVPNDTIYFVQIIKRDKDNPGQKSQYNAAQYLKEYYFEGLDEFKKAEMEI